MFLNSNKIKKIWVRHDTDSPIRGVWILVLIGDKYIQYPIFWRVRNGNKRLRLSKKVILSKFYINDIKLISTFPRFPSFFTRNVRSVSIGALSKKLHYFWFLDD